MWCLSVRLGAKLKIELTKIGKQSPFHSDSGAEDGLERLRGPSPTGTSYSTPGDFYRGSGSSGRGIAGNCGGPSSDTDVPSASGISNIQPLQSIMKVSHG